MSKLIFAAIVTALAGQTPNEIVYLPEGSHQITATVDGKPKTITVHVPAERGKEIAELLQAALNERLKSNVRPWFDFEHKRGVASALLLSFRYEPGKGVMAALEWTGSGRKAIEGKDFSYFSPEFYLGDDGIPDGIPAKGPLGGLVNEPAFREIPRIAASDAAPDTQTTTPMSKLIFAALAISAAAENAEGEAVKAIEKLKVEASDSARDLIAARAEITTLKGKVEAAENEMNKTRKDRAESLVKAAMADGRILPKDDDTAMKYRARIEAGDTFAEEILASLPKRNENLGKDIVIGSDGKKVSASDFEAKATALVTAGTVETFDEALARVAASEPAAYNEYLKNLNQ